MPMYEYRCPNCGKEKIIFCCINSRDDPYICQCGSAAKRMFSTFSVVSSSNSDSRASQTNGRIGTGIKIEDGVTDLTANNNYLSGCDVGISIPEKTDVNMDRNMFVGVRNPIEIR